MNKAEIVIELAKHRMDIWTDEQVACGQNRDDLFTWDDLNEVHSSCLGDECCWCQEKLLEQAEYDVNFILSRLGHSDE